MIEQVVRALRLRVQGRGFVRASRTGHGTPADDARILVVGPDPIRILLCGGDYAVGYNAPSRRSALDGALADVLHAATGRGVVVENRSRPDLPLAEIARSLGATGACTFDLVLWAPTFDEARRPGTTRWELALDALVHRVRETSTAGVVLLTIPALTGLQPIAVLARARAARLARAVESVAARHPRCAAVRVPPIALRDLDGIDGPATYRATAVAALPAVLDLLAVPARLLVVDSAVGGSL